MSTNGVNGPPEFEDTGEIAGTLYSAVEGSHSDATDFLDQLARKLVEHGSGGNGDAPAKHAKSIKRHNWLAVVMALLLGPGGAIAVIYATSDRSKENGREIEHLQKQSKSHDPRIKAVETSVIEVKNQVADIDHSMNQIEKSQKSIAGGIEELKLENLSRLKNELTDAKRELRRRRKDDDDR